MSMTGELTPSMTDSARRPAVLTLADGLMIVIGLLAAWLRFGDLAGLPLSAAEAQAALAAHNFWTANAPVIPPASPAYFSFTGLIMGLGAGGDAAARFVPALFGVLTVLLPWLWRGRVRPIAWLAASLFMALSPLLAVISRTAGGDAIALFALLLLAVAGVGGQVGRGRAIALGAGLGLGLASSPLFYTGLVALLPAAWLGGFGLLRRQWRLSAAVAAATFILVASFGLFYMPGIGAALRLFPVWLARFGLPSAETLAWSGLVSSTTARFTWPVYNTLATLLAYEPAVVLLGGAALALPLGRNKPLGGVLRPWLAAALLLALLQSETMANLAVLLLPGYLLAGLLAAAVAEKRDAYPLAERRMFLGTAVGLMGLGALMLAAFGRFTRLGLLAGDKSTLIILSALAFIVAVLLVVLVMAWESAAARRGALLGLAVLLLFWQWGTARQLTRLGANDPRERWVVSATDDGARVMFDLLRDVSWQLAGSGRDLKIVSQVESPVLDWYLRDTLRYQSGPAVPLDSQADVVITPDGVTLSLPNDYFGADFVLARHKLPAAEPPSLGGTLRWALFRESTAPTAAERVVVWIRSDLAR